MHLTAFFSAEAGRCSVKKVALKDFAKFTEKRLC